VLRKQPDFMATNEKRSPTAGLCAYFACLWETTARNPGNAHRYRDFNDTGYVDFLASAAAIAPVLERAIGRRVGETVLASVEATRAVVPSNTNLGIILLLTPLAAASKEVDLRSGVRRVLASLDVEDARLTFQAIRLAAPAGLGEVAEEDVRFEPSRTLLEVMRLAAERDSIALQYTNGFKELFEDGCQFLQEGLGLTGTLENALIYTHLKFMALLPDSLIARKRGQPEAVEAADRAQAVLDTGWPGGDGPRKIAEFDDWLRGAGRGRNPGTTSDLVTASLFVALRENIIRLPLQTPWTDRPEHA
jgi:triphosphoribosyl-dephospho-CoA synthase